MRRVPVITLASLVAVLAIMAAPVYAATLFGNDTPDIRLGIGEKADKAFDLGDFFDSATSKTIEYKKDGAVTDPVVSIFGDSKAGTTTVKFSASAGGETVETQSVVQVSSFRIQNIPAIDNNNRIAGVAAGNVFLNGIVPGKSVASVEALTLAGGAKLSSALTGGSATGSAALIATIGEVKVSYGATGLYERTCTVLAEGVKGVASFGGLKATLKDDGTYTLAADSTFVGPYVVTLGVAGGNSADAVHVLAAKATNVALTADKYTAIAAGGGSYPQAKIDFAADAITVTAEKGQAILVVANAGVAVPDFATVSINYSADKAAASVAVIGFDAKAIANIAGNKLSYDLLTGAAIEAGKVKNAAVTAKVKSGSVLPAFQVYNPGETTLIVKISSIQVIAAAPLVDYAINPNAAADTAVPGDLSSIAGLGPVNGGAAGTADSSNHFASANGAGCLKLTAGATATNMLIPASNVDAGSFTTEAFVKKVASTAGTFFLHTTDGVKETQTQVATDELGNDWEKVINTGVAAAAVITIRCCSSCKRDRSG